MNLYAVCILKVENSLREDPHGKLFLRLKMHKLQK